MAETQADFASLPEPFDAAIRVGQGQARMRSVPNDVPAHCFWRAQMRPTGVSVPHCMTEVTFAPGSAEIDIIVKSLPMCYPDGLII